MNSVHSDLIVRVARFADAPLFWEWANDKEVRDNSWSPATVELSRHLVWFKDKLESKDSKIYVLESGKDPVAQVRYDRKSRDEAEIDFSVSSKWRGKGVGTNALRLTREDARSSLGVCRVVGVVKTNNVGSCRAFQKASFTEGDEREIHGQPCRTFYWPQGVQR